jgi:hypothetical protein
VGWSESKAGLEGDGPADAFGEAVHTIQAAGSPPTVEEVIASLIAALNCDGQREQLFQGKHRIAALRIHRGKVEVRISSEAARPAIVRLMYDALDVASEAYRESFGRPPSIPEVLQYIEMYLQPDASEGFVSDPGPWKLAEVKVVRSKTPKAPDRLPCPDVDAGEASPKRRVSHRKFGSGVVTRDLGATVEVLFDDGERRVIQRGFLLDGPG